MKDGAYLVDIPDGCLKLRIYDGLNGMVLILIFFVAFTDQNKSHKARF